MQPKTLVGGLVIIIILLASWRMYAGRVDRTNPDAVATAFFKALKSKQVDKAGAYFVPDGADAWEQGATRAIDQMQSGMYERFFEDLPAANAVFVSSTKPKSPTNEKTLTCGGSSVDMRQLEGKWYVCKAPI